MLSRPVVMFREMKFSFFSHAVVVEEIHILRYDLSAANCILYIVRFLKSRIK